MSYVWWDANCGCAHAAHTVDCGRVTASCAPRFAFLFRHACLCKCGGARMNAGFDTELERIQTPTLQPYQSCTV